MSQTYYLHCNDCKERIWIGQGHDNAFVIYSAPEYRNAQQKFAVRHLNHNLAIGNIDYKDKDGFGYEWIDVEGLDKNEKHPSG